MWGTRKDSYLEMYITVVFVFGDKHLAFSLSYTSINKFKLDQHFYSANSHVDMVKCTLHQLLPIITYLLGLDYFVFHNNCDITFLTVFILTHPVNFPCGRKPEHPEKTFAVKSIKDRH